MSHRRRILNLVTSNKLTGVYSLRRVNLLSRQNNLFYPSTKAAEDAAAAKDPAVLFPADDDDVLMVNDDDMPTAEESLEKVEKMQVPPLLLSFQPTPDPSYTSRRPRCTLDCAALSETRTVFVDGNSRAAFLHDAGARRVVAMPGFPERESWASPRIYFPAAGAGDEGDEGGGGAVYAMDYRPTWGSFYFEALVHRDHRWHHEDLPPPPYVGGDDTMVTSYARVGAAAADVMCVSTEDRGTYCFDTASRAWSKAGGWALPFAGKIEHDRELGVWLGFLRCYDEDDRRLCASTDLFTGEDRRWLCSYVRNDCRDLEPPWGWPWHKVEVAEPQVVGLGSGKFCVAQFFETMRSACSRCGHEDADRWFAVFTGVEVVRRGRDEIEAGKGNGNIIPPTELRVIGHKSKRYMLTKGNTIEFVL